MTDRRTLTAPRPLTRILRDEDQEQQRPAERPTRRRRGLRGVADQASAPIVGGFEHITL